MAEQLDRTELLRLLEGLSAEKDEDVVGAARAAHAMVVEAGTSWDALLTPEPGPAANDHSPSSEGDAASAAAVPLSGAVPDEQEALQLITRMLARDDISDALREELEGYRDDITDGQFDEGDRKYVQALYERLGAS